MKTVPSVKDALYLYAAVALTFLLLGAATADMENPRALILAAEWTGLVAFPLALAWRRGWSIEKTFLLRPAPLLPLAAGVTMAAGVTAAVLLYAAFQNIFFPMPPEFAETMARVASFKTPLEAAWVFFILAATPAFCEEFLCRGLLLSALRSRLPDSASIWIAALLFAALHFDPWRFVPTLFLGVAFGWLAVRMRSLAPAVAGHMLNNAVSLAALWWHADSHFERAAQIYMGVAVWCLVLGGVAVKKLTENRPGAQQS